MMWFYLFLLPCAFAALVAFVMCRAGALADQRRAREIRRCK